MKTRAVMDAAGKSGFRKYRDLVYGDRPLGRVLRDELLTALCGGLPGGAGLWLRSRLYPRRFAAAGRGVFFGRNVTLRHAHKIRLGAGVVVDDNAVLDAKGTDNAGITIGDGVYIGRNTIVYCKNGAIEIGSNVNISSNCEVFSSNSLTIGPDTVIGAYSYLLSGGEYDYRDTEHPFAAQSGMETRGPLTIGANCWIGARVTVLDAACVGAHCVLGAGAVVNRPVPAHSVAVGVPARVVKSLV
jgi:acetyltransferase-like isoleucine patch superfamily enzyme